MAKYILTITEMARLKNITSETLRHYDRIGLLKPDFVSGSGIRSYSICQYERLGTILELKQMGLSLKEIRDYMENRNFQKSMELLKKYQRRFEEKLDEQTRLNEIMKQKLSFLDRLSDLPSMETVFEQHFPERYMVTFGKPSGDREEHAMAFAKLENCLHENMPILASDRIGVFSDISILTPGEELVGAVPMILAPGAGADREYMRQIPEGDYVCMYYKNGTLEKYDPSFERVKNYIREKSYRIDGMILQVYKLDVTLTSNREETVLELQVPVKSI